MTIPLYYYYRKDDSDRDWIANMFYFIPDEYQQRVADRYERIFRVGKGRKAANFFLNRIAKRFK